MGLHYASFRLYSLIKAYWIPLPLHDMARVWCLGETYPQGVYIGLCRVCSMIIPHIYWYFLGGIYYWGLGGFHQGSGLTIMDLPEILQS